jgi:hypothetical protein
MEQLVGTGKGRDFGDIERPAFEEQWTRADADTGIVDVGLWRKFANQGKCKRPNPVQLEPISGATIRYSSFRLHNILDLSIFGLFSLSDKGKHC